MALIIPNVGLAALADPTTGAMNAVFDLVDSIQLDIDGKLQPVNAGPGMYPVVNISADRAPKITISGVSLPLNAAKTFMGATVTAATDAAKIQIPVVKEYTIGADGIVNFTDGDAISATDTNVSVVGKLDGKVFTQQATPQSGEYAPPVSGDTKLTFSTSDAGTQVIAMYTIDSSTGGHVDIATTTISPVNKFIAYGKVINAADRARLLVPVTLVVNACQFVGSWTVGMERQKASSNSLELQILDPGGSKPAMQIITAAKFAG